MIGHRHEPATSARGREGLAGKRRRRVVAPQIRWRPRLHRVIARETRLIHVHGAVHCRCGLCCFEAVAWNRQRDESTRSEVLSVCVCVGSCMAGGGTVFFVHPDGTPRYLAEDAEREEGGTPNVIGCIRYDGSPRCWDVRSRC
jgi:hypothetical protein